MVREIHGVAGAKKRNSTMGPTSVRVTDGDQGVELIISACEIFAELTPEQARYIGKQLIASANRIEKANKP